MPSFRQQTQTLRDLFFDLVCLPVRLAIFFIF
jgi:hypothetical protein